ncbi:MAG: hypothetical protein RLY86_1658 [Pseudomonadota bacterium]|jgi:methyl-accepting chemotaxis protein
MGRFSIGFRILLLVAAAVAIVGLVNLGMVVTNDRLTQAADRLETQRRVAALSAEIERQVTATRALVLRYTLVRDPAVAAEIGTALVAVGSALDAMQREGADPRLSPRLHDLADSVAAVATRFATVEEKGLALGHDRETGLIGRMHAAVQALDQELRQWPQQDAALRLVETMRRAELETLMGGNAGAPGLHRKSFNEMEFLLTSGAVDPATATQLLTVTRSYRQSFQAVAEVLGTFRTETTALVGAVDGLVAALATTAGEANAAMAEAGEEQRRTRAMAERTLWIGSAGMALLFLLVAVALARGITVPIRRIEAAILALADGRTDVVVPGLTRGDEVGRIARAADAMRTNLRRLNQEIRRVAGRTEGEEGADALSIPGRAGSAAAQAAPAAPLAGIFADMVDLLGQTGVALRQIGRGTSQVAQSTDQASAAIRQVLEGVQSQLQDVQAIGREIDTAAAALAEVAGWAGGMADLARRTSATTDASRAQVDSLAAIAKALVTESGEVQRITALIQEIAETTNILSVNASIEARRAGPLGRGFENVAHQVRILSQNTEKAALEIRALAESMSGRSQEAAAAADSTFRQVAETSGTMATVDDRARLVADAVQRQHATMPAIQAMMNSVSDVAAQNAVAAEQIKETMAQLAMLTEATRESTARFARFSGPA